MNREEIKEVLYNRYIVPTENKKENSIGIEIEMPVVNLSGQATDFAITKKVVEDFRKKYNFEPVGTDVNGYCYSATEKLTGDNISFDCSYNNLEISFGKEENLIAIWDRFSTYISKLNDELSKYGHILTGMGVNPGLRTNSTEFLPVPRYRMLEGFLKRSRDWEYPMYFHPYPEFATYACASQVQLDVTRDKLISTIKAFSLLEPIKSLLFANAWMEEEPDNLCVRDMFWENSTHGINPHNIGMFEHIPENVYELMEYISRTSIFCTERDGHYLHFKPIPIIEYFNRDYVEGEYFENGIYHPYTFTPKIEDISFLRTYKFEDLTYRGTIEYRSGCCQPFADAMSIAAFHVGLSSETDAIIDLMSNDTVLYHRGYTASELRKLMNRRYLPEFVNRVRLERLCEKVLELARQGLVKRGYGEERFIEPLFERAASLESPALKMVEGLESGRPMSEYIKEYAKLTHEKSYEGVWAC